MQTEGVLSQIMSLYTEIFDELNKLLIDPLNTNIYLQGFSLQALFRICDQVHLQKEDSFGIRISVPKNLAKCPDQNF